MAQIQFQLSYTATPERVWQALTGQSELAVWLMENNFATDVGHEFMLWPGKLAGFDGPISATVLSVEPGHQLRMGWRVGHSYAIMTWQVERTRGGCRLKVTQAGSLGSPARADALEQTYRELFDQRLRTLLDERPAAPATPMGVARGAAALRMRWPVPVAAATVLVVAGAWFTLPRSVWPGGSDSMGGAPGAAVIGSARTSAAAPNPGELIAAGSPRPGLTAAPVVPGATRDPAIDRLLTPAPSTLTASRATLSASVSVRDKLTRHVIMVTIDNTGTVDGTWHTLSLELSGLNLLVSDIVDLTHQIRDRLLLLSPLTDDLATVKAHGSVSFTFTVAGLLRDVSSCRLDQNACTVSVLG